MEGSSTERRGRKVFKGRERQKHKKGPISRECKALARLLSRGGSLGEAPGTDQNFPGWLVKGCAPGGSKLQSVRC